MSSKATSAGFMTLRALLLAPLSLVAGVTEPGATRSNLTNLFYIHARTGQQHIALDGGWDLSWRDYGIARPI